MVIEGKTLGKGSRGRPRQKILDWMMVEGYKKLKEEAQQREEWRRQAFETRRRIRFCPLSRDPYHTTMYWLPFYQVLWVLSKEASYEELHAYRPIIISCGRLQPSLQLGRACLLICSERQLFIAGLR